MKRLLCLAALCLAACTNPQRIAEPIWLPGDEVPTGRLAADPVATVQRHSDPVDVQRPGAPDGYRMSYHEKRARLRSGAAVIVGPGGRAELLWEGDASSVVLFGDAVCVVGDPSRDEPMVRLERLLGVQLRLTPEDRVILPGGAELRAVTSEAVGPFRLEMHRDHIVRLRNQSKVFCAVRYRGDLLELAPGDRVDLPVLAAGTAPLENRGEAILTRVGDHLIESSGRIEPVPLATGVRVRALEEGWVTIGGVEVRLTADEEVVFSGLGASR